MEAQCDGGFNGGEGIRGQVEGAVQGQAKGPRGGDKLTEGFGSERVIWIGRAKDYACQMMLAGKSNVGKHLGDVILAEDEIACAGADHGEDGDGGLGGEGHEASRGGKAAKRKCRAKLDTVSAAVDGGGKACGVIDADFDQHGMPRQFCRSVDERPPA